MTLFLDVCPQQPTVKTENALLSAHAFFVFFFAHKTLFLLLKIANKAFSNWVLGVKFSYTDGDGVGNFILLKLDFCCDAKMKLEMIKALMRRRR